MIDIFIQILLTAISYMVIPIIFTLLYRKTLSKQSIIMIVIINGIVVFIGFTYINYFILNEQKLGNIGAALLWSILYFAILQRISTYKKLKTIKNNHINDSVLNNQNQNNQINKRRKDIKNIILFAWALIASCAFLLLLILYITNVEKGGNVDIDVAKDTIDLQPSIKPKSVKDIVRYKITREEVSQEIADKAIDLLEQLMPIGKYNTSFSNSDNRKIFCYISEPDRGEIICFCFLISEDDIEEVQSIGDEIQTIYTKENGIIEDYSFSNFLAD